MKLTAERPFANPEAAARKFIEIAPGIQAIQDGRLRRDAGSKSQFFGA
ncbi:hypothetical protein Q2941_47940 [Bradyrhizobium sp. UFLA05-153]